FPANSRLRRALKGRKALAAAILTLAVTAGIVAPAAFVGVVFARQGVELAQSLSQTMQTYRIGGLEDLVKVPFLGTAIAWLDTHFHIDVAQIQAWIVGATRTVIQFLLSHGREVLFGAFGLVGDLTVMLFVLFFFFRDGD